VPGTRGATKLGVCAQTLMGSSKSKSIFLVNMWLISLKINNLFQMVKPILLQLV